MPLTATQVTSFFTSNTQMGLTGIQRAALAAQGLATPSDFSEFGKEELDSALKNMRTAIPGVAAIPAAVDVNGVEIAPAVPAEPAIPPVVMPAKSTHRLEVASIAWHYYTDTGRTVTSINMHYNNVLKDFYIEWKAIESMAEETKADVPLIDKNNPPLKWIDTFEDFLMNTFGVRKTPLAYVTRQTVDVPPEVCPVGDTTMVIDPLTTGEAFGSSGAVLDDLIARLSHIHPLYKSDNAKVYSYIEEATRGTAYSSTVKAFARKRNGRGAWKAMKSSHAGNDKWEQLAKENNKWLLNTKWNGRVYTLEKFCNQHRTKYVNLEEAKNHVDFQLPTKHTRVGYLLDNIENPDADLRAALANIRQNVNNTRNNFENAVGVLLPVDPYVKHRRKSIKPGQEGGANISSTSAGNTSANAGKCPKTGVEFRFHVPEEYRQLNGNQKYELKMWRKTQQGKQYTANEQNKRKHNGGDAPRKATIQSAVKTALEQERKKQKKNTDDLQEMASIIASVTHKGNTTSTPAITSAHMEAVQKLIQIKNRVSKK